MKSLVTGGAGFIGSHLVEQLVKQGVVTSIYDNLTSGSLENIKSVQSEIELVRADIRDLDTLISSMRKVDWVFHLAALTSVSESVANPVLTQEINVTGTLNVLWASLKAGVSRVVIASSCAVYGEGKQPPLNETNLPAPRSPYAASKLASETLAESFYHSYGLETVCLRYFNVYGPRQKANSEYASVVPRFIQCYKERQSPQIYGNGLQSRDFIHVNDLTRANILATSVPNHLLKNHRVFNIGTGISTSLVTLLKVISNAADYQLTPNFQEPRKGDVKNSWADCTLAREKLGFTPLIDLNTGIKTLYKI
ncbi:MAG TPA: GDP-mannose 4,6-dehydratase [Leptolyngbyaceae cyanobacterium]